MTDRELLEAAAKAAGGIAAEDMRLLWFARCAADGCEHPVLDVAAAVAAFGGEWGGWNPLNDDGDALRLAVKLGIELDPECGGTHQTSVAYESPDHGAWRAREPHGTNPYAATRRAIVRAAAAMAVNLVSA